MMKHDNNSPLPALGIPELVRGKAYIIHQKAVIGNDYIANCPVCKRQIHIVAAKAGANIEKCEQCDVKIGYNVIDKPQKKKDETVLTEKGRVFYYREKPNDEGRLTWGFLGIHSASLRAGQNIIGRKDKDIPSDISFDDDYMSRRSILIDVEKKTSMSGYTFKLTVLRAANPVIVNSHELYTGNSIYINYGDTIKLGNTVLTFKSSKKS